MNPATVATETRRLLAVRTPDLREHESRLGAVPTPPADVLIRELDRSGLDGRGGAGFPVARKLAATLEHRGPRSRRGSLVVANGAEGEPASAKDALLLAEAPHLVLDGLVVVASALGASEAVVATTADRAAAVERAIGQRRFPCPVRVRVVPHAFVTGEASAVASAVTGGAGRPLDHRLRLSERGPDGRSTLVSNVETLASVALVARYGADWFRAVGSASAPGTRLVTVGTGAERTVLEVAGGTPVRAVLAAGGVDASALRAVLVGGYGGAWLPASAVDVPFDADGLRPWAASPGAGVLLGLGTATCPLGATADIARGLAGASAGRCGPCVNGLPRMADVLGALARSPWSGARADRRLHDEVLRVAALVDGRGACHHPDGVARLVRSAMAVFRDDVSAHLDGTCVTVRRAR